MAAEFFSGKEILNMRRFLAKTWRQKLSQVMDYEAIHYLREERREVAQLVDKDKLR